MKSVRSAGIRFASTLLSLSLVPAIAAPQSTSDEPWRLDASLPDNFRLGIQHRIRYESLSDQFRAGRKGDDQLLVIRTLIHGRLEVSDRLTLGAELEDSRAYLDDDQTPISTGIVNAAELLRLYASITGKAFGGQSKFDIGRLTMDVGSRRLVARNRFRNTLNAFTGLDWQWQRGDRRLRAFYTLPIRRRPSSAERLRRNDVQIDDESTDATFWGLYFAAKASWGDSLELYAFGLDEEDAPGRATRNRELITPGFRIYRPAATGRWDYQVETAYQFGDSRTSTSSTTDLDHSARFHHAEVGYSFDAAWSPRLIFQYDWASGDDDPDDRDNNRFDTLFGARRFDFGPTSIYGPFARANLVTPGLRLQFRPAPRTSAFVSLRVFELESATDAWTTARVRDPTGRSGRALGSQIETRIRYELRPGNVRLEGGLAYLDSGSFLDRAPNSNRQGDSLYGYFQTSFTF